MEQSNRVFSSEDFFNLQKTVEQLQQSLQNIVISKPKRRDSIVSDDEEEIFPIESIAELDAVEKRLRKEKEFRNSMIRSLSKIGGTTGELQHRKVAEYVMKTCFDRNLLQLFSFTGTSKNKNVAPKPGFVKYQAVIRLIFTVVHRADRTYSFIKNERFLQNFFKFVREKGLKRRQTNESDDEEIQPLLAKRAKGIAIVDDE